MKILLLLFAFLSLNIYSQVPSNERQFPNDGQIYIPGKDTGFSQYLAKSLRGTKKVVLTFDDGPDALTTPRLLDTLKKYNVKATFFVLTGSIDAKTLPIVKRMIAEGVEPVASKPEEFGTFLKREIDRWAGAVKAAAIEPQGTTPRYPSASSTSS